MPPQKAVETVSIQPAKKEPEVVVLHDSSQANQSSSVESGQTASKMKTEYTNRSFTDKRGVSHNGYFYTKEDSEDDCRKDTDNFIKELHQELGREVVGGYTVVYNDTLSSYVAKFVGLDGLPIKDATILTPKYKPE